MPSTPDIDVSALAEALNEKLDRDGYNATNDIKEMMAHMGMPSGQYINLTVPASGGTTIAPMDGWFTVKAAVQGTNQGHVRLVNGSIENQCSAVGNNANYSISTMVPVSKNNQVVLTYGFVTINTFRFYYANGTQHLASN